MANRTFVVIAAVIIAVVKGPIDTATAIPAPSDHSNLLEYIQPDGKQYFEEHYEEATERQLNAAKANAAVDRRKAVRNVEQYWPNATVPYFLDDSLDNISSEARQLVKDAIAHWETHTCLRFVPYNPNLHKDYVIFLQDDRCSSPKGRQGGAQIVHLVNWCVKFGSVVHEIGHAIGWVHEHKRPDRDRYVKVDLKPLPESERHNYELTSDDDINTHGVPYDHGSIMHYGYAKGVLEALDDKKNPLMGQRIKLSFYDIKLANIMYKCAERNNCKTDTIKCIGDGYIGPKCTCLCPDGVDACSAANKKRGW